VIEGELAAGNQKVREWQVDATPTLIIDGKYRVTANPDRGIGFQQMVQIALQLVDQELAAKRAPKARK
jgi:thiol:disulfide interchange protein DsbA